jgi:hypothetical protein
LATFNKKKAVFSVRRVRRRSRYDRRRDERKAALRSDGSGFRSEPPRRPFSRKRDRVLGSAAPTQGTSVLSDAQPLNAVASDDEDARLMLAAQTGDALAFEELMARNQTRVCAFLQRFV